MAKADFQYEDISGKNPRFRVRTLAGIVLGEVEYKRIPHIRQSVWEATAGDGHRAMHEHRSQAAQALAWNPKSPFPYPMPV